MMARSALMDKADRYAHAIYRATKTFPREEQFGVTSQLRRAALSVPLNIIEGFARQNAATYRQFLRISYASLKESLYLVEFSREEKYFPASEYDAVRELGEEVAKMLWSAIQTINKRES